MTKIHWTDETWNPIVGCSKTSEGCENCYAENMAYRLSKMKITESKYAKTVKSNIPKWTGKTNFIEKKLNRPGKLAKSKKIFVCSMGDLFHESNDFEDILKVWEVMLGQQKHVFQILTKRPQIALDFFQWLGKRIKISGLDSISSDSNSYIDYVYFPNNIWFGVTIENQKTLEERLPLLFEIPSCIKFLSCEPLLEKLNFVVKRDIVGYNYLSGTLECLGEIYCRGKKIDWIIAGGENGHNSRKMHKDSIYKLYSDSREHNVPFFFKGFGTNMSETIDHDLIDILSDLQEFPNDAKGT